MNAQVVLLASIRLLLLPHIQLMLVIDEIDDRRPRITVVHVVAEARSVDDGQLDFEGFLLQLGLDDIDLTLR